MGDAGTDRRQGAITIAAYEGKMLPGVSALVAREYGGPAADWADRFSQIYEHPYQRDRSVRLVALDRERIVGLIALCYWPYVRGAQQFAALQAGNALIAPDYRGHGIFGRLLRSLDATPSRSQIDFLIGFPVATAFGSYVRNGWTNPLNLSWYARIVHASMPLSAVDLDGIKTEFDTEPEAIDACHPPEAFSLSTDDGFVNWRRQAFKRSLCRYFHHTCTAGRIRFDLKLNRRGRIIELVIGDVATTNPDPALLEDGLRSLVRATLRHRFIAILTVALNRHSRSDALVQCLRREYFFRLPRKIRFIVKGWRYQDQDLADAARWRLLRKDIDSW